MPASRGHAEHLSCFRRTVAQGLVDEGRPLALDRLAQHVQVDAAINRFDEQEIAGLGDGLGAVDDLDGEFILQFLGETGNAVVA